MVDWIKKGSQKGSQKKAFLIERLILYNTEVFCISVVHNWNLWTISFLTSGSITLFSHFTFFWCSKSAIMDISLFYPKSETKSRGTRSHFICQITKGVCANFQILFTIWTIYHLSTSIITRIHLFRHFPSSELITTRILRLSWEWQKYNPSATNKSLMVL